MERLNIDNIADHYPYDPEHCESCQRLNDPEYKDLFYKNLAMQMHSFHDLGYAKHYPIVLTVPLAGELSEGLSRTSSYRRLEDTEIITLFKMPNSSQQKIGLTDLLHLVAHAETNHKLDQLVNSHI
jgi:hypothetical protein